MRVQSLAESLLTMLVARNKVLRLTRVLAKEMKGLGLAGRRRGKKGKETYEEERISDRRLWCIIQLVRFC